MRKISVIDNVSQVLATANNLSIQYDPPADGPRDGRFVPLSMSSLDRSLHPLLDRIAPSGLFTHQHAAIESVLAGKHTVTATRTSSGKSLIFSLPALDALAKDPNATALLLYPQKALANDQLSKLREQVAEVPEIANRDRQHLVSRYDGGVPDDERKVIREQVQLLLTNPDMLHLAILQHHNRYWARFFANLKIVAIDECHEYRGIFGSNVGYVLRRLRQVCQLHGANPTFVATSATIADPQEHLHQLVGCDFDLVDTEQDGSLQGRRKFWMVGSDDHYYDTGRKLAMSLVNAGLNVLAFCPSRVAAERMLARMRRKDGELPEHVAVYRSGLTQTERETIERGLRDGTKSLVFSTSALELGIDIGNLDVVVCIGLPNSMMSLWQRAGRVARAGREGAIVLIPGESPLESHYARHPNELFNRPCETLALNLSNERVLCQQYACALQERGGDGTGLILDVLGHQLTEVQQLRDEGKLTRQEFYCDNPHGEISLRNTGEHQYQIKYGQETIGEIGSFHLLREAPRNALYRHNGRTFRVRDIAPGKRIVRVVPERTRNETVAFIQKTIIQKKVFRVREYSRCKIALGRLDVTEYLKSVTEKDASGKPVKKYSSAGMPPHRLPTEGLGITLSKSLVSELQDVFSPRVNTVLASIERLMANLFPTVSGPVDSQDISSGMSHKGDEWTIYLYDNVYDGVKLTALAFDRIADLLLNVKERIQSCDCGTDDGCMRCVADPMHDTPSSKSAAILVIDRLLEIFDSEQPKSVEFDEDGLGLHSSPRDVDCLGCGDKIPHTARFCSNCGKRNPEAFHECA